MSAVIEEKLWKSRRVLSNLEFEAEQARRRLEDILRKIENSKIELHAYEDALRMVSVATLAGQLWGTPKSESNGNS